MRHDLERLLLSLVLVLGPGCGQDIGAEASASDEPIIADSDQPSQLYRLLYGVEPADTARIVAKFRAEDLETSELAGRCGGVAGSTAQNTGTCIVASRQLPEEMVALVAIPANRVATIAQEFRAEGYRVKISGADPDFRCSPITGSRAPQGTCVLAYR